MAVKLKDVQRKVAPLAVDLGDGDTLNVQYRPYAFTPDMEAALQHAEEGNADAATQQFADIVCGLVAGWDLLGEDNKPVPLAPATIRTEVPSRLCIQIIRAINTDLTPGE